MPLHKTILLQCAKLLAALLLGGLLGGALVRSSAGFGVDERELDARLSRSSIESVRASRSEGSHFLSFYLHYLWKLAHGDFGYSTSLNRPVRDLIRDRFPVTLREIVVGLAAASVVTGIFAWGVQATENRALPALIESASAVSLCLPLAVLGYVCILLRFPTWAALTACTFPHLFRYTTNLVESSRLRGHVLAARARGVRPFRMQSVHILLPCLPDLLALAGVTVSIAFGAAVPIEFATETPGVGQLAWQAASSRDLPLLCILTMIATMFVVSANGLAEIAQATTGRDRETAL